MPLRELLPARRALTTFEFEVGNLRYIASYSCFEDDRIGEISLRNHKSHSQSDLMSVEAATAASLALQHGCPLEELRKAIWRGADGCAFAPLGIAIDLILAEAAHVQSSSK